MSFDISKFAEGFGVSESDTSGPDRIEYIDLDLIDGDPDNGYSLADIEQLADNIQTVGLLQPLRLRPGAAGRYVVSSGHRRRLALRRLVQDGDERFSRVPCIVDRDGASPALQELRLLYGNANNRAKTSADLAQEARRVEALLVRLKGEGFQFRGRTRTMVAQLLQVSETRVANAQAIQRGLAEPELIDAWKGGELPESLALRLARLDPTEQSDFVAWVEEDPAGRDLTGPDLDRFLAGDEPEELSAEPAPEEMEEGDAEENEDVPDWQRAREAFAARLRAAREATGLDKAAFAEKIGAYKATYSAWENGDLPGSGRFPELARALGVTTDYLYGLTDDPHGSGSSPELPEQQLVLAGWMPGGVDPSEPGLFAAVLDLDGKPVKRLLRWQGGKWLFEHVTTEINVPVLWWLRLPPVPGEEDVC